MDLCFHIVLVMVWMGETGFRVGDCSGNHSLFFFFFLNYCSGTTPFYVLVFYCPGLPLWATARKRPQRRDQGQVPHWCALTCFLWDPLFTAGEGRAERCSQDGCRRVGWSEQVPSPKFLPEKTACLVYHVSSDSYETQNQHYGRSLTKETVKDGISKFFHNGYCLRKDAIAASIQKIKKILEWFEGQTQLNFYASSLLFVYEGSCQATTVRLSDVTLAEKRGVPKGLLSGGDILEYNNNIHVINSTENGKIEASVSKGLSKFYALHKKAYSKRHHSQLSLKVENLEQDNVWKSSTCITQEHLNGNVIPQLEKVFCHMPAEIKESANVEVRMIDFAHVFPSNTKDEGYIYGLKNLITVLQNILDN
ncbi:inositol polyphosphate multikinase isoform 2-T2 [Spheniscus humboldti]